MTEGPPPAWRLPDGVNNSLWEYAHSEWLAESEDSYFLDHPLFREDARAVDAHFTNPGALVDLGSGVGRLSLHFARRGFPVTAIELSQPMLRVLLARARSEGLRVDGVQANLCDLRCLPDGHFRYALSMFSTLGMVRSPQARQRAVDEAARILAPGALLALHAHNVWINVKTWEGRLWLASQFAQTLLRHDRAFDRTMTYRGIPRMEVHLYRWGELARSLRRSGFRIKEVMPIDSATARMIRWPWLAPGFRAGGWIVFACRTGN